MIIAKPNDKQGKLYHIIDLLGQTVHAYRDLVAANAAREGDQRIAVQIEATGEWFMPPTGTTTRAFIHPGTDLRGKAKPGKRVTVQIAVSQSYNGGTVVDGKWYSGYRVAPPTIPAGYELSDIGVGLCLNSCPPIATKVLREVR